MNKKKFKLSIFVFRRDFRLFDNTGLIQASKQSEVVIPCFIFDPLQNKENNTYFAHNCYQFMIESIKSLNAELQKRNSKLYIFQGCPEKVISQILEETQAEAVFVNRDYTPFSITRDHRIRKQCISKGIQMYSEEDSLLIPIKNLPLNFANYKKFTPFYTRLLQEEVKSVDKFDSFRFYEKKINSESRIPDHEYNKHVPFKGGRQEGLRFLSNLPVNYQKTRSSITSHNSNLSAHNKFGTISIRQFYHGTDNQAIRKQLYARQFYYHVIINNSGLSVVQKKYEDMNWQGDIQHLELWKKGQTGVPIVDAAMRELQKTGFIHYRLRMIVASFLIKDLLIDWREGQLHFAHYLVDYDPAQNNGNWQCFSATGTDCQPYFRIFNPKTQSQTYDPKCQYIRKWIPQLQDVPEKSIHNWQSDYSKFKVEYPKPIVKHSVQKQKALRMYKTVGNINFQGEEVFQDDEQFQGKQRPKKTKRKS